MCVGEYMIYLMIVREKNYFKVISNNLFVSLYRIIEVIVLYFVLIYIMCLEIKIIYRFYFYYFVWG